MWDMFMPAMSGPPVVSIAGMSPIEDGRASLVAGFGDAPAGTGPGAGKIGMGMPAMSLIDPL